MVLQTMVVSNFGVSSCPGGQTEDATHVFHERDTQHCLCYGCSKFTLVLSGGAAGDMKNPFPIRTNRLCWLTIFHTLSHMMNVGLAIYYILLSDCPSLTI